LENAENNEFSGTDRRDANLANQPAVQDVVLTHGCAITGDEKCFLLGATEKCTQSPLCA
jgi:hypothetical protein